MSLIHNVYRNAGHGREIDREKATKRTVRGIVAEASTAMALALMREGVSQAEAARRVGVSARTLRRRPAEIAASLSSGRLPAAVGLAGGFGVHIGDGNEPVAPVPVSPRQEPATNQCADVLGCLPQAGGNGVHGQIGILHTTSVAQAQSIGKQPLDKLTL
jgi:predicted DNA-binding protein (UPF0251 family)